MTIKHFNNISSWRHDDIIIAPHEVYTLNFRDTTPNVFVLNNPNQTTLKIGVNAIPRADSYEFRVEYNSTETIGQPHGTRYLYILNDSDSECKLKVFSIETIFNPEILKNMNVTLEGYNIITNTEISGFGVNASLPSGTNHIGAVNVDNNVWTAGALTELMNAVKNVKINTEGASFDMSGATIDTAWTDTDVLNVINKLQALVEKEDVEVWTASDITLVKNYLSAISDQGTLEASTTQSIKTDSEKISENLEAGKLTSKALTPNVGTATYINPDTGYSYISDIHYMRAIGGAFTFQLKGASGDTTDSLPELTLEDGSVFNDFRGKCYGIIVKSASTGAKLEIVYSQK